MASWAWRDEAGLARRFGYGVALAAAALVLGWNGWFGHAAGLDTIISRIDVVVTVALLGLVPWLVARKFGSADRSALPRTVRAAGCAAVLVLVLVKTHVQGSEYAHVSRSAHLAGAWTGEVIFLLVIAAYLTGVFAVTAHRAPARPAAIGIGTLAGGLAGLILYALPPRGSSLNLPAGWIADSYQVARVLAVPLVIAGAVVAGVKAARRSARAAKKRGRINIPARQGLAAGACTGVAAAMVLSILGMITIALVPQDARVLQWSLPGQHLQPGSVYAFEVSLSQAAAGFLLVLLVFPLLGAGLGAWGGLYADQRRNPPGGGGGGRGPRDKGPKLPPSPGGRRLDPRPDLGWLLSLPEWDPRAKPVQVPAEPRREKTPAAPG